MTPYMDAEPMEPIPPGHCEGEAPLDLESPDEINAGSFHNPPPKRRMTLPRGPFDPKLDFPERYSINGPDGPIDV